MRQKVNNIPAGARDKLPFWFSAAWSSRSVALALNMVMAGYQGLYFTDVLGLNPVIIATLLVVAKIFDAFTDLVIGFIVDKTHTKIGKARPYEISIVLLWLCIFLMYSTPKMGMIQTYAWVFVTYVLQSAVFITILYGTDTVYLVRAVRTDENRTKVTANAGVYTMIVSTIVGIIIPQVMQTAGYSRKTWSMIALCLAIPCATIGMMRFIFIPELDAREVEVKEEKKEEQGDKLTLKKGLRAIKGNKYLLMFAVMYFCYHLSNGMSGGGQNYYLKYVVGDLGVGTWINLGMVAVLVLLIFAPKMMDKFGTGNCLRAGLLLMILGPVVRIIGGPNTFTLVFGQMLFVAGSVPIAFMLNIYLFQCMDYGEWKTGTRIEGMMGSLTSFMSKVASALSGWMVGAIMSATGYVGTAGSQTGLAITGIKVCFNVVPIIIAAVAFVISLNYNLDKKMPEVKAALEEKIQAQ